MGQSVLRGAEKPRAVIHVDLDGARHIYRAHGWSFSSADDSLFASGLVRVLDFLEAAGLRATLFVIAEDLADPTKRELLQIAAGRGHQLASHSHSHRRLPGLPRAEKWREIWESRERIQAVLGVEVPGFRAPGFGIDQESLELIAEAGYVYDASLFSNGREGVAGLRPVDSAALVEVPLPRSAGLPFPFHPSYSLVLGMWYFRWGLRRFRETGAPLVLLFHLTDLADPLPVERLIGWRSRIYTLSHLSAETKRRRCQAMLDLVSRHYTLIETRELLRSVMA